MLDSHYAFPTEGEPKLRQAILDRFTLHFDEAKAESRMHLCAHPNQWANVVYELDLDEQKVVLFRLLSSCPNPSWIDRAVTKCITFLDDRGRMSRIMVSGVLLRNCGWLHSAVKDPDRDTLEYYYSTVTFMCYVLAAWEVLENSQPPLRGAMYYFPENL